MIWLYKRFRDLWSIFTTRDSAKQMAWGLALGFLVGVVPKGNLLSIILMITMFSARINLAVGVIATVAFSWMGLFFDPVTHAIGHALLTFEGLRPFWTWFFDLPVIPWTNLNNTVVMGSFLMGLAALYPVARSVTPLWQRHHDWRARRIEAKAALKTDAVTAAGPGAMAGPGSMAVSAEASLASSEPASRAVDG